MTPAVIQQKRKTVKKRLNKKPNKKRIKKKAKALAKKPPRTRRKKKGEIVVPAKYMGIGRKPKLTDQIVKNLITVISAGNYVEVACKFVGISVASYYSWLVRGQKELDRITTLQNEGEEDVLPTPLELPYVDFLEAIERSTAQGEITAIQAIRNQFASDWRAPLAFLERRHRSRWAKQVEVVGNPDLPVRVILDVPDNGRGPKKDREEN